MQKIERTQPPVEQISETDPFYLRYRFATPADSFYTDLNQNLSAMIGFESETRDYHSALSTLNTVLNMGLDDLDLAVFRLLLTSLDQANRFGGDLHICPVRGENSAVHTLRTLILDTEVARRAGNLSQESQSDSSVQQQRIRRLRCLLSHDMGEIPGEQSTLASRAHDPSLTEMPEIEREVFRVLLTEAYLSAHSQHPDFSAFSLLSG